jgi:hypothetical protein
MSNLLDTLDFLLPTENQKNPIVKPHSRSKDSPLTIEMEEIDPEFSKLYNERMEVLISYVVIAERTFDLADERLRQQMFAKLSYGLRKAGEWLGWARYHQSMAKSRRKQAEAIASLEGFGKYLSQKKGSGEEVKATESVRSHYIQINPEVMLACSKEALMDAIVEQLMTVKLEFIQAISTIKAMAWGMKDSDFMSGSSVSVNSQQ